MSSSGTRQSQDVQEAKDDEEALRNMESSVKTTVSVLKKSVHCYKKELKRKALFHRFVSEAELRRIVNSLIKALGVAYPIPFDDEDEFQEVMRSRVSAKTKQPMIYKYF